MIDASSDRRRAALDLDFVRRRFPALQTDWALFDNAGGSVPLGSVADAVAEYLRTSGVQLGASYALSAEAGEKVRAGHRAMAEWIGADEGEVIVGPSTTLGFAHLARALRAGWREGDAVVVTDLDHEANIGPWLELGKTGIEVREWRLRPETADLALEDLEPLLDARVRLVAMTHCANVVGRIRDVAAVAERVHAAGALLCVDGVAYAPHRRLDVAALGADFYGFSLYKTYGPHQAVLWGRRELLEQARGQSFHFVGEDQVPYKFQPGGANHELVASLPAIVDYFHELEHHHGAVDDLADDPADDPVRVGDPGSPGPTPSERLDRTFERIAEHEESLAERLLAYLEARPDVRIIGPRTADRRQRVPTIAFVVDGLKSSQVPPRVDAHRVAIRWGDFYAPRAIRALGLEDRDGVVRVSMVHYNTHEEVDRLLLALDQALDQAR